ncbi:MAG TPA: hypothetical protein VKG67_03475 [Gallionellaceae bacterium]|nr:hypothetical protein [Gallionellaceae bacterium]
MQQVRREFVWLQAKQISLAKYFLPVSATLGGRIDSEKANQPKTQFYSRCGHIFLGQNKQGNTITNELNFIRLEHKGLCTLKLILRPSNSAKS